MMEDGLQHAPPPERWDDWREPDGTVWPARRERRVRCVPTICFNCEAACGLLAYVDRERDEIVRFEGNPLHPGSRGRTCAKGPATLDQLRDPERILHPLRRVGPRGGGRFERASWDEALDEIGGRIRGALDDGRHDEVMYHVGRPGDDHFVPRLLAAWGVDGHNSHTNVCSASARAGYMLTCGADRPSPDFERARTILLLSAHLETGHYFNPHAQRIVEAQARGARLVAVDTRLSNTASRADLWISTRPGSETTLLLAVARELIERGRVHREFVERWSNWRESLAALDPHATPTVDAFLERLRARYAAYDDATVVERCGVPPGTVGRLTDEVAAAGTRFASHLWRNAAAGNLGGWQVARALMLLHVLTGSVGTPGGVNPSDWDKHVPLPPEMPPPVPRWNETIWPRDWPLAHYEMSFLLPYLLERDDRRVEVYVTRVYNPVWTNPDGTAWIEMFEHERRIGCHVAITPTWNETAQWADWVLPTGLAAERHDLMSQETHAGRWIGFRQPVLREHRARDGRRDADTRDSNPGEVWEEAEWWIALTWRIDPDGSRGIRRWYESRERPGEPIGLDEYYASIFEGVPGLPEAARAAGLDPLGYMRRFGAFELPDGGPRRYEATAAAGEPGVGFEAGERRRGFETPSRRLEIFSPTLADWGWPEQAWPGPIASQVDPGELDEDQLVLLPTFRLPTLIHTRSANAGWLVEISNSNPLWIHPDDADGRGIADGDLVRVETRIGHFVQRAWRTEGIHPGVVGCSHHLGRWRLHDGTGSRTAAARVTLERDGERLRLRRAGEAGPYAGGVHQNLAFPVQPDPVSGMHCWHQRVRVAPAAAGDRPGDVVVDRARARAEAARWMALARPASGPGGLRRPRWLKRPLRPAAVAYEFTRS